METLTENKKNKIIKPIEENWDVLLKDNSCENILEKLNTWLSVSDKQTIKEKLWNYFEIENFILKPVFSINSWNNFTKTKKLPSLLCQKDGSFLFIGSVKNKIKKIAQKGEIESLKTFFLDLHHEQFLGVVFYSFE